MRKKEQRSAYRKAKKLDREKKKLACESLIYLPPKKYRLHLAKYRARSQLYRERKRNEAIDLAIDTTKTTSTTTKPKQPEQNAFSTRQAYHRSIEKGEKYLTFSPRK